MVVKFESRLGYCQEINGTQFLYGKVITKAYKKDLEEDDLYEVVRACRSKKCGDKLEAQLKIEKEKGTPSTFKLLWTCYGTRYILLGMLHLSYRLISSILEPEAIGKIVAYFAPGQTVLTLHDAIYYASIMIGLKLLHCFYFQNYMIYLQQLAIQIRTAFCSIIYRKALKLSPAILSDISLGNIITVITKDVLQFEASIWLFNDLWIAVVQSVVICYLIYAKIGLSSTVGVGMLLALIPVQVYVGKMIKGMRLKINKRTDERLQITQESLSAIRIIKMYTWEKVFGDKIDEARKKEMKIMLRTMYLKIALIISSILCSKVGFYVLIMAYIYFNTNANAEIIFYLMRCFGTLRHTVSFSISMGMTRIAELSASLSRINRILNAEELENTVEKPTDKPSIGMKGVKFSMRGNLGCGKSSLVKVILKDYPIEEGILNTSGRMSYASQDPWLFPSSIKQNILFGEPYDEDRYKAVIRACALQYDLSLFEKGDETIVADRGLNLSKGPAVAHHIFNECIRGFLKDRLCVLVTHNAKHIANADYVIILDKGTIKFQGKNQDVSKDLLKAIEEEVVNEKDIDEVESNEVEAEGERKEGGVSGDVYARYFSLGGGFFMVILIVVMYFGSQFTESYSSKVLTNWINIQQKLYDVRGTLNETGIESTARELFNSSLLIVNSTLLPILATDASSLNISAPNITADTNNSFLTIDKLELKSHKTLNMYSMLIVSSTVLELIKHYLVLKFARNASVKLHRQMIDGIIYSVMSFFDNYFIGNILNRFAQDLTVIDEQLPFVLSIMVGTIFSVGGIIILIAVVNWRFFLPSLLLLAFLILLRMFYMPAARSLKRLESATRSPIVGHLNSSMEGLTTIRAYKAQSILKDEFDRHQDLYTSAHYTSFCAKRAFAFYMDFSSVLFMTIIIARFLFFDLDTAAGDVGLAITQAAQLSMVIQFALMQWSETENLMTSVERVLEYTRLEKETTAGVEVEGWPSKGEINYVNVSLKYATEKVLKNISFSVKSKQKIGIVGRTGAGKSSIISTLFRLYNYEGQIFIDDVEIKTLSLNFLRQHISIIPQDPIMFAGTVRSNIDPLQKYTDEEIWSTVHKIQLEKIIPSLDYVIADNTSNFSTGQRQLICLARAIIRKNKIVVLDEATANMDPETEFLIQKAIVENFSACTVFIIAHRLQSILDCHKVIVMEKGEIVEYEDPLVLMEDKSSMFSKMLTDAGLNEHQQ
ncbi:hypothetical protein NQ318_020447 [Aromia moschata]|uniref:Multidrug resistance-associated protein lethal(2)03659 n=1 Tax=Aromia moschata TaxID=1265417 RepID=A0AAV8YJU9_9CUCU|nr:hypothetical protein NQ318_020447 [Aromia moschata]